MSLKINNVSKSFDTKEIVKDFSYSFKEKGLYVITGESGSGKTTLLRIIAGLDTDFSGEISGGGVENVSFMFQEYRLFPSLNALKNANISQTGTDFSRSYQLLSRLGFTDEDMKKKPRQLSGGMKQRVAFARAVLMDAPILILDEPTKELDADTAGIMLDIISEEAEKRLVIAVTHDETLSNSKTADVIRI